MRLAMLIIVRDARHRNVLIQELHELVMAAHFVDLAAFLMQAQPPAFLQRKEILDLQPDTADTRAKA
jgi:hypothetical protein